MSSLNQATLIGNLGGDAETRSMPNGTKVANLSIATTDKWKDRTTGEAKEKTEWHRVTFYDRLAEVVAEYGKKGRQVFVAGKIRTRKWTDAEGVVRWSTEIVGYDFKLLGAKPAGQEGAAPTGQPKPATAGFDDMDDDIPF
jgi:single-strand DNA-binding protein